MKEDLYLYHLTLANKYKVSEHWTDKTYEIIEQHKKFLRQLGNKGHLDFAGRTNLELANENLFGIALIKAGCLEEVHEILAQDPAVQEGIQKASIFPYLSAMAFFENFIY